MHTQVPITSATPNKKRACRINNEKQREVEPESERLLSRRELALRQGVSTETIKRREKQGLIKALRFNERLIRYRLSDIIRYEAEAAGGTR